MLKITALDKAGQGSAFMYFHFSEKGLVKSKEIFNLLLKAIPEIWDSLVLNSTDIVPNCYFYLLAEVWRLSESQTEDLMPHRSRHLAYLHKKVSLLNAQRPYSLNGSER